jgi:amidase
MSLEDVLAKTALEQAALIRSKEISSEELTRAVLARIDAKNPTLNAFVTVFHDSAIRTAKSKDAAVRKGGTLPVFHGVPLGVKDMNYVRFARTRMGSRGTLPFPSPMDDRSATSLRRGGFVFVGKTATSEFGALPVTEPDIHPPTVNPWNTAHLSGGSSGGAAAAVAAGILSIAHGSDGGGSVRIPSAFCHLFGHKASRGRFPNAFGIPDKHILYTCGPLAQTVGDAAAMVDLLARLDINEPHWAPAPAKLYRETCAIPPKALRIRFTTHTPLMATDPDIKAGVERAAKLLADQGHDVAEAKFPTATLEEFLPVWAHLIAHVPLVRWSKVQPVTKYLYDEGMKLTPAQALALQQSLAARFLAAFDDVDVWLTPTSPVTAPKVGSLVEGRTPEMGFKTAAPLGSFTAIFNVTGQPASSVPMGLASNGLPMGLQVVGKPLADDVVLALSKQLEGLMPWRSRRAG